MKLDWTKVLELSHRMIPGKENFKLETRVFDVTELLPEVRHRPEIWYVLSDITFSSHMGTHVEFPFHHWKEGKSGADFPLQNLIGEGVVLDFSHKRHREPITLAELKVYDERIREGDIVLIRTDKDKLFRTERWEEQPYFEADAIEWLVHAKKPKVVGTDASGFEIPGTDYQPNHLTLFQNGVGMIESCTNLAAVGDDRVMLFILALPIEGIDACPVRIIAVKNGGFIDE